MNRILGLGLLGMALALASSAWAQAPVITSSLTASRVDQVDGHAVLRPAAEAKPGDTLEYTAVYANQGDSGVGHLMATLPIPAGTTLVAGSAAPTLALASTDAQHFAPMPLMHDVVGPDGKTHREAVPLAQYRALRWDVGSLQPGQHAQVRLHVHIDLPALSSADRP